MTASGMSAGIAPARALDTLPVRTLTGADLAAGRVATLQAAAAQQDGPVVNGFLATGHHAGPCAFVVGLDALDFAYGPGRAHLSSAAGWLPILGRRFGRKVINSDEPDHVAERRLWSPAFTTTALAAALPLMDAAFVRRLPAWVSAGTADAYAVARELSFAVIGHVMIGLADDAAMRTLHAQFAEVLDGEHPGESIAAYQARLAPQRATVEATLRRHIALARAQAVDATGLLGLLLRAEPALADDTILEHCNIVIIAGHETTASLLAWLLVLLADHPRWQRDLRAELGAVDQRAAPSLTALDPTPLTDAFLAEVGRLRAPLQNAPRVTTAAWEYAGVRIPAGHPVALAIGASHLQAADFPDPEAFIPERFLPREDRPPSRTPVTFATGARHCVGARFARLELKLALWRLLARATIERADDRAAVHAGFWNARPAGGLRVRFAPHEQAGN